MKKLIEVIKGNLDNYTPIWLMRQAGRYLPEYRQLRATAGSFLNMCYDSELSAKITMQPIERFDFDAAIIFSDILLVPQALGMKLHFEDNIGPTLNKLKTIEDIEKLNDSNLVKYLEPVYESISLVRKKLSSGKVRIIRDLLALGATPNSLSVLLDLCPKTIYLIRDGKRWNSIF